MCYLEFEEIIDVIKVFDVDVIFIEMFKSYGELIYVFEEYMYN